MEKLSRILIVSLLFLTIAGCAVYRSRLFEPFNYIEKKKYSYTVDSFESWDIEIGIYAYKGLSGIDTETNHKFLIRIDASTSGIKPYNVKYKPIIKNIQILYSEGLQHEIALSEIKPKTSEFDLAGKNYKYVSLISRDVYIPHEIELLTVVSEIEFLDEQGNIIKKKFTIQMKRIESSKIGTPVI